MGQEVRWLERCTLGIIFLERSLNLVQKLSKLLRVIYFDSRGVAQPGSATVLGTVGREFESRRPDQQMIFEGVFAKKVSKKTKNYRGLL